MHRSIAGYNPYYLFFLTIDYSKNFTTNKVLAIGHMSMFVVKSIVIQINGLAYEFINYVLPSQGDSFKYSFGDSWYDHLKHIYLLVHVIYKKRIANIYLHEFKVYTRIKNTECNFIKII